MSPSQSELITIILALKDVRQFVSGSEQASKAVKGVGDAAEQTGKKAQFSWKTLAKWGGIATAAYGATRYLKSAVSATEDLGKTTLALNRTTGMSIQTGAEWGAVLKGRGIETKQFQMGLVKLSREVEKTAAGTKKHNSALEQLGITSSDVAVRTGDTQAVLMRTADALSRMDNPTRRAALAQQLFGRQAIALAPILFKGSAAIQEQLDTAGKYVKFGDKSAKQVAQEIQHQRELKTAYLGVQVSLGTALLPALLAVTGALVALADIIQPVTQHSWALWAVIGALTTLFVAFKIVMLAATIAETLFNVQLGITAILITGGVVVAVVALIAVIVLLIKHWGWVKARLVDVWNWLKGHWPLLAAILLGPFALAALLVIKHIGAIRKAITSMVSAAISALSRLVNYVKSIPGRIGGGALGVLGRVRGLAQRAHVPAAQAGGIARAAGGVLVGERGPELVHVPRGAAIEPLPSASLALPGGGEFHVRVPVYLDRRVLAEGVARFTADQLARR